MGKEEGTVMDFITVCICILAISTLLMASLEYTGLLLQKVSVSQTARRYLLKMETEGYLDSGEKDKMLRELRDMGVTDIDLTGTTLLPVSYGDTVELHIKGKVTAKIPGDTGFTRQKVSIEEVRMSTAKH